jgi:hypothetical protein
VAEAIPQPSRFQGNGTCSYLPVACCLRVDQEHSDHSSKALFASNRGLFRPGWKRAKSGAPEAQNEAPKPTANNRKDWLESPEVELDYQDVQLVAIGDEANQYAWRDSNPQPTAP